MAIKEKIRELLFGKETKQDFSINSDTMNIQHILVRESAYGTKQNNGWLFEEYSERFKGRAERYAMFLRMDNDGQVFQMRNAINLMKTSTKFFVDPYSEEGKEPNAQDVAIAKFVEKALFQNLDRGFKGFIEDITLYVRDGFSLFELYFEKKSDGFFPQLTRIYADTVFRRLTSDGQPGIQQIAYYPKGKGETDGNDENETKNNIDIPANKLLLFNINAEGTNYEGWSLYRKISKDRYFKDRFENFHAVLQERLSVPPLKIKVPQGTKDEDIDKYRVFAENMRSLESGYVVEYVDDSGNTIVGYDWMQTDIGDNANKLTQAIQHYQQNINDVFFQQFLYLGKSEKGSYGMAGQSTAFFFEAVKGLLEKDMEIINRYLIPKIVALNFGETERLPKMNFGQVGLADPVSFSTSMSTLVTAGLITSNYETEKYIRSILHLPEISEEEYEEEKKAKAVIQNNNFPEKGKEDNKDNKKEEPKKEEEKPKKKTFSIEQDVDNAGGDGDKEHQHDHDCDCHIFSDVSFDHESIINHQVEGIDEQNDVGARSFSDPIQDGFWRPLTFAERRVNLKSIKDNISSEQKEVEKKYAEISDNMLTKLLSQVQNAIEKNDMVAIADLTARYGADIATLITITYKKLFDYGKNEASREIGVQIPESKKDLKDVIKIQADNVAQGIISKVETDTKAIIASEIEKNTGLKNTSSASVLVAVKRNIKPYLDQAVGVVSTISVNQAFNSGRKSAFYSNSSKLYAVQYSAIIDGRTSNRCLSLDGKVMRVDSPDYKRYSPPQHYHCRSMLVGIRDDEEYKPEITEIPSSIPVKDTLSSKEELKAPVLTKDSPAVDQIQKEINRRVSKNDTLNGKRKEKNEEIIDRLKKSIE